MAIEMKEEKATTFKIVPNGYLQIAQETGVVAISGSQLEKLLVWLKGGAQYDLETEWNGGVDQVEG